PPVRVCVGCCVGGALCRSNEPESLGLHASSPTTHLSKPMPQEVVCCAVEKDEKNLPSRPRDRKKVPTSTHRKQSQGHTSDAATLTCRAGAGRRVPTGRPAARRGG